MQVVQCFQLTNTHISSQNIVIISFNFWSRRLVGQTASQHLKRLAFGSEKCTLTALIMNVLKDQYGPRVFFLEFPFFAENMIIRSILNLWWHSEIPKLILGFVRGMFTKRLKGTRQLLYTVKSDFFKMTALHSKC